MTNGWIVEGVRADYHQTSSAIVLAPGRSTAISNIVFPASGQLRSRKVVSRSRARPAGKYPSWKMRRMLQWESENELNAFRLLDCDPDVTRFDEQPCETMYALGGQPRRHYPDILVQKKNGQKELWEVKGEAHAEELEIAARTRLLIEELPQWGFLLGFGRSAVSDCEQEFIRQTVKQHGSLLWSDACCGNYGSRGFEILCSLVLRGSLTIDMNSPISPSTRFIAGKEEI